MGKEMWELADLIVNTVEDEVAGAETVTQYRDPLVAFAPADDPRFAQLRDEVDPAHRMPEDLLSGARSVVSFFVPFEPHVLNANAGDRTTVAREWAVAYGETNALIDRTTKRLIGRLAEHGVRAAAEGATHNFDPERLVSWWSHKSVAVITGLGSFGLHHMIITDAGCAGRLGSLVLDADLPARGEPGKVRCLFFHDGSCRACVDRCPVGALDTDNQIDKRRCWHRCQDVGATFEALGSPGVCGKCAIGPCSFESAV
jgi:epoxyqueuosine reductase QueG